MLPNSEWILLALLAIILIKPEDIPAIFKTLARIAKQAQDFWNGFMINEINEKKK